MSANMRQVKKSEKKISLPIVIWPSIVSDVHPTNARPVIITNVVIRAKEISCLPVTNLFKALSFQVLTLRVALELW